MNWQCASTASMRARRLGPRRACWALRSRNGMGWVMGVAVAQAREGRPGPCRCLARCAYPARDRRRTRKEIGMSQTLLQQAQDQWVVRVLRAPLGGAEAAARPG